MTCKICRSEEHARWCPCYTPKPVPQDTTLKIIEHLKANGRIDDDDVAYFPEKYPFTRNELQDFMDGIYRPSDEKETFVDGTYFETYNVPFVWEEDKLNMIVIYGQGSAWMLMTRQEADEWIKSSLENAKKWCRDDG
jgi:hypothetical protein